MLTTTVTGYVGSVKFVHARGKTPVLNVNLASNRRVGDREFTDWISAKVWGDRSEKLTAHIHKGMHLLVTGRPEARGYKKPDGTPAGELILHVAELEFLSPKAQEKNDDSSPGYASHVAEDDETQLRLTAIS